jgi:hypothetical protein
MKLTGCFGLSFFSSVPAARLTWFSLDPRTLRSKGAGAYVSAIIGRSVERGRQWLGAFEPLPLLQPLGPLVEFLGWHDPALLFLDCPVGVSRHVITKPESKVHLDEVPDQNPWNVRDMTTPFTRPAKLNLPL